MAQSGLQREPFRGSARHMSDGVDVLRVLHDVRVLLAPLTRRRDVTLALTGCDTLPQAAVDEQKLGRLLYKLFTVATEHAGERNGARRGRGGPRGWLPSAPADPDRHQRPGARRDSRGFRAHGPFYQPGGDARGGATQWRSHHDGGERAGRSRAGDGVAAVRVRRDAHALAYAPRRRE